MPYNLLVSIGQVYSALRHIKTSKSPGPDNIPNKRLNMFAFELAPVIRDIYNTSMRQGIFPSKLKCSFVVPVPKTSLRNPSIEGNLRPISLTSQVSKIMENVTLDSLLSQIIGNLDNKQFALIKKSGTHALVYLICIKSMLLLIEVIVQQDYFSQISRRHLI